MQERFVPQITEIEPGRLEKRRVSYAQKLRLMYLVNPAVAAILAAGITAAMLGLYSGKVNAADSVTQHTRVVYADTVPSECPPAEGSKGNTYWTTCDNANNSSPKTNPTPSERTGDNDVGTLAHNAQSKHPVEFYINIPNTSAATLMIKAFDVESSDPNADGCGYPEVDKVYINNNYTGNLVGVAADWSISSFNVPASYLNAGDNLVKIVIDPDHPNDGCIGMMLDYGALDMNPPTPTPPPSVGGITGLTGVTGDSAYSIDQSNGIDGKEIGFMAGGAAAAALAGAGAGALRRRK
ncbi:hypothetical protein A3A60_02930 [Candidatus Curtissbacteria bacterium RIFCSPLOWO2_01_FULL_42_26]|uniref:Uncharacterized protein n=1 Tax=Candidatus Curtissbacteria bacterium RIFCSPLOWO2_01_FULL_42_26 TaxID=1797729 RepID=A0A1F5I2L3_9BACT|nr:MAG: hypothetical protein A3A60_02930 [Candidatus Curtissbacteria bacterium RIFCSPLOWO2_01_FULL_42_26]